MQTRTVTVSLLALVCLILAEVPAALAQEAGAPAIPPIPPRPPKGPMTFFITSVGMDDGANLGGLEGADAHCQTLAAAAGAGNRTWRAYLSTQATLDSPAINARDRIGQGPWHNARGVRIAVNLGDLHGDNLAQARTGNLINLATALTEKGDRVPGEYDPPPNQHDILTGTRPDGTAYRDAMDRTCNNWTSNGAGSAQVGHHDRVTTFTSPSWNSAHPSLGCSQEQLRASGGAAQFYCFAAD